MRYTSLSFAAAVLAGAVAPVMADLVVSTNFGTVASSTIPLVGTTVGKANNAFVYTSTSNTGTTLWGNGEVVYQFTLAKPAYLYMTDILEPDADGTFPDPNHDYFLLTSPTTFNSDNTATSANVNFPNFTNKPEATSIAFVQDSVGPTTAGSNANIGIFRNATTNPKGIYAAGTYYVSVDARSGTLASFGLSNQLPAGNFSAKLNVKYVDEAAGPTSISSAPSAGAQITGTYSPGQVVWTSFVYDGSVLTLTTEGNTLNESGGDTFLALYDSTGALLKFNDDVGFGPAWSSISIAAGELTVGGTYYLGLTEYKAVANPGFDLSVYSPSIGASGSYVINGLAVIPEPSNAMGLLGGLLLLARRRR